MSVTIPEIRVGDPVRWESLTVFPLFADPTENVAYELSDEAIHKGTLTVEEVSESGSVPDLSVDNQGDVRVLFLEGEELVGAKQNRILNTSVLIAAHTKSNIPVSCVERGRWGYTSRRFGSSGSHSPTSLRRTLKATVTGSVRRKRGHRSDQGAVWQEVAAQQAMLNVDSATSALSDSFRTHREHMDDYREKLPYVDGAVGAAVAIKGTLVTIDLFDKPTTCGRVWDRLLSGAILDALAAGQHGPGEGAVQPTPPAEIERADVERAYGILKQLTWEPAEAVGEGEEHRAESPRGDHASALSYAGTLVHGSIVYAVVAG